MDWGHFGNWEGRRLYGFGLLLCYSRMRYVEFTQRQDIHHLLECMVHAFGYLGGVTECVLTDRMKTVLLDQKGGELHFHKKFLDFAAYYGFVPRVCRPYRPETKEDRVDHGLCEKELLAGDPLRVVGGSEPAGSRVGRESQPSSP
jgi:transposase